MKQNPDVMWCDAMADARSAEKRAARTKALLEAIRELTYNDLLSSNQIIKLVRKIQNRK